MDTAQIPPERVRRGRSVRNAGLLIVSLLTLAGIVLRVIPWLANYPLHNDEALYGAWARLIVSGKDPWLLTAWIDKPPLTIYALAGSLRLFGISERALRVPGMLASILTVPLVYGLAREVYSRRVAAVSALLVAASPFAILFAPTAFTDSWLTLWLIAAAWAALAGRPIWAGIALGLALASKQQGVLGAPLVLGLLCLSEPAVSARSSSGVENTGAYLRRIMWRASATVGGFLLILAPLTLWDSLRWATRPSFWDRSLTTYGGLRLATFVEWPMRAGDWATQLGYLSGAPLLSVLILAFTVAGAVVAARHLKRAPTSSAGKAGTPRADWVSLILAIYVLGYLTLHFAITFQPWDRYLLPLVPLVSILAAQGLAHVGSSVRQRTRQWAPHIHRIACTASILCLGYAAWLGAAARIPVGSDHGAYAGIDQVMAALRAEPADAVIYHQWLSWDYDFYLFDAPQERRWFDRPEKLAADAEQTAGEEPARHQLVAVPDWEDAAIAEIQAALTSRQLRLEEMKRVYRPDGRRSFTLFQIVPLRG